MFVVNGIHVLVLFDSGATRSFMSLALSKKFDIDPGALDFPLEVEIVDDHTVSALRVHGGCVLEMFQVHGDFPLAYIPMNGQLITIRHAVASRTFIRDIQHIIIINIYDRAP